MSKRKGEQNKVIWKEAVDFVRLAARTGAAIVPFGAVGADDAFDLFMDTDEILAHPVLGPLSRALYQPLTSGGATLDEAVMPITSIPGTPLPSPVPLANLGRVYFKFGCAAASVPSYSDRMGLGTRANSQVLVLCGCAWITRPPACRQPIDTLELDVKDAAACESTYAACRASVEGLIDELLQYRESDPDRSGWTRLRGAVEQDLGAVTAGFDLQESVQT